MHRLIEAIELSGKAFGRWLKTSQCRLDALLGFKANRP